MPLTAEHGWPLRFVCPKALRMEEHQMGARLSTCMKIGAASGSAATTIEPGCGTSSASYQEVPRTVRRYSDSGRLARGGPRLRVPGGRPRHPGRAGSRPPPGTWRGNDHHSAEHQTPGQVVTGEVSGHSREHRLHREHYGGLRRRDLRLCPTLNYERQRRGCQCQEQHGSPRCRFGGTLGPSSNGAITRT